MADINQLMVELENYVHELARIEHCKDDRFDHNFYVVYSDNTTLDVPDGLVIDAAQLKQLGFDVNNLYQKILAADEKFVRSKILKITDQIHGLV